MATHSPYSVPVAETTTTTTPLTVHCPYAVDAPAHGSSGGQKSRPQSRRSKDGKRRGHNNNGNKAAKEASARPMPVCLDHLKGICTLKRLKCKFSHPPLDGGRSYADLAREAEAAQQAYSSAAASAYAGPLQHNHHHHQQQPALPCYPPQKVCEVYQLTGFCKFGQACRDYHPPQGPATPPPPCAPAISNKMSEHCREAAESAAATLHPQLRGEKAARRATRDLAALLGSLPARPAGEGSDEALRFILSALRPSPQPGAAASHGGAPAALLTPAQVAAALHARAVEVPHESDLHTLSQLAAAASHHCPAAAAPLAGSLLDLCTRLVYQADDLLAAVDPATGGGEEQPPNSLRRAVDEKKAANLRFLGALASDGVLAPAEPFALLEFLLQRGGASQPPSYPSDAPTHCLLAGQLLRFAGPLLARADPSAFARLAGWFHAASARHTPEVALAAEETTAFLRWSGALPQLQPQPSYQQLAEPVGCGFLEDSARSFSLASCDSILLAPSASASSEEGLEDSTRSSTPSSNGPDLDSDEGCARRQRFSI